ncbi:hypothetical protein RhiirA1_475509 [Rhizophagus irregularis]|uniref:Uncharacterized protein n=1 Tax=Rhizophagus irregularis TaxID=588596 RepID=A0A2N0QWR2_9GLOM|nr:hypothetical protein RhiirA1_475509 [Rhizophagus irregularis]
MSIEDWDNICNRKFVENFSSPKAQKHFLQLSYFRRQGHDEKNAMKGLKTEENVQWEMACHKAEENLEKSVAEDLQIRNQSLSLFGFKSYAKTTPDLNSAIKAINAKNTGFGDKGAPELPPYRPKPDNDIQELFDSIGQDK